MTMAGSPRSAVVTLLLALILSLVVQSKSQSQSQSTEPNVCLATDHESSSSCKQANEETRALYLAVSSVAENTLGLYTSKPRAKGEHVADPDLIIPFLDSNKNEWSPLHDFLKSSGLVPGVSLETEFLSDVFIPGAGAVAQCSDEYANIQATHLQLDDSLEVHRSSDPTAGSFAYRYNFAYAALRDLIPGEELILPCSEFPDRHGPVSDQRIGQPIDWVVSNGICLDALSVGASTIKGAGRGAFSKRTVEVGQLIATSPVVHFDRSQLEKVHQSRKPDDKIPTQREHGIKYTDRVVGSQLLLNYCYGHPDSNFLFLPYAPVVNFINHNSESPNAAIRWSPLSLGMNALLSARPSVLMGTPANNGVLFDFVALRDIQAGEEILIDYGDAWSQAWEKHVTEWKPQDEGYVSASEFLKLHDDESIRTTAEQTSEAYPRNLQTACYFRLVEGALGEAGTTGSSHEWSHEGFDCLRPCAIEERITQNKQVYYKAVVYPISSATQLPHCDGIPAGGLTVSLIPANGVTIVDKPKTTDTHLQSAFRHEIGVPSDLYPEMWMTSDPNPLGDFAATPLEPGEVSVIRWRDSGKIVAPNAHRLGLPSSVRTTLLDYCNKMGITDYFRHLTIGGNAIQPEAHTPIDLQGEQWFLQRPPDFWQSNMQWISPGENQSQQSYLEALSIAGFDSVLAGIGETLGMEGLVAFHVTFIGVSFSTRGYMHYDVTETGAKAFNVIIPLILVNDTGPELGLHDAEQLDGDGAGAAGRYRYEYDVASMMGDDAYHATSAADYRSQQTFRMAATVYVADINEDNVDAIINDYTQKYPPVDRDLLLAWAGTHWKKGDPSVKLPTPSSSHILSTEANTATIAQ